MMLLQKCDNIVAVGRMAHARKEAHEYKKDDVTASAQSSGLSEEEGNHPQPAEQKAEIKHVSCTGEQELNITEPAWRYHCHCCIDHTIL